MFNLFGKNRIQRVDVLELKEQLIEINVNLFKILSEIKKNKTEIKPEFDAFQHTDSSRIFALSMFSASHLESRLYLVPAKTLKEATEMAQKHLGDSSWYVSQSSFIDIQEIMKEKESVFEGSEIVPKIAKKNAFEYVSYLQYASSKFCKTKEEKAVIEQIISRINKKHGISTN